MNIRKLVLKAVPKVMHRVDSEDYDDPSFLMTVFTSDIDDWDEGAANMPDLIKRIHGKIWPTLKKLGYVINKQKIGRTQGFIEYYPKNATPSREEDDLVTPLIMISASTNITDNSIGYGCTILEVVFDDNI